MTESRSGLDGRKAWGITSLLFLAQIVNYFDKNVLSLAAPQIMQELHLSSAQYGLVASSFYTLYALSGVVVGLFVAHRVPSKPLLLGLVLVWSLAQLPIVFFASLGVLLASRVALGVSEGPGTPTATSACHEWFSSDNRNMPTAMLMLGSSLGSVIAGPVLSAVIAGHGWRGGFLLCSVLGLSWAALWAAFGASGPATAQAADAEITTAAPVVSQLRLWFDPTIIGSIVMGFCAYWVAAFSVAWTAPFVRTGLRFDAIATGWIFSAISATSSILLLTISFASQRMLKRGIPSRFARAGVNVACMAVGGLCFLGAAFMTGPAVKLGLLAIGSALPLLTFTLGPALVSEVVPAPQRGRMLISIYAGITVAGFISPVFSGYLIGNAGLAGYNRALVVNAIVVLAGALAGFILLRPDRTTRNFARSG